MEQSAFASMSLAAKGKTTRRERLRDECRDSVVAAGRPDRGRVTRRRALGDFLRLPNKSRGASQYYDQETGKHYNYFRDYDPAIGRYVESDPIGLRGGINTYSYSADSPLKYFDPQGLSIFGIGFGGSGTWGDAGFSAQTSVVHDTKTNTTCIAFTACLRYDAFGVQANGGISASLGEGRLCSGVSRSTGVYGAGGAGLGGVGSLRTGDSGGAQAGSIRLPGFGQLGAGIGAAVGFERCKTTLICTNESPCCKNPGGGCQCEAK